MQVSVLASGSKGNSIFIEMDGTRILIDAGISARRIKQELAACGQDIAELDGIFITHEHSDHISGLANLSKRYKIPVFSRPDTFRMMSCYRELPFEAIHAISDSIRLGKVSVKAFSIPHDAADPVGYSVCGSRKCTVATDLGFVTESVGQSIEGSHVLVLEANHDVGMVRNGPYPWPLKQRILGNRGHLANDTAGWALTRMKQRPEYVFLAHLSDTNNRPELAMEAVRNILEQQGSGNIRLVMTAPKEAVSIEL